LPGQVPRGTVVDVTKLIRSAAFLPQKRVRPPSQRRRRDAGWTLTELAISLGVLATLMAVVFISKGFIADFREDQTITTAIAIQKAAPLWAERRNKGMGYGGGNAPRSISTLEMCNSLVLNVPRLANGNPDCNRIATAWKTRYDVAPYFPNGWPASIPTSRIEIKFCVPAEQGEEVARTTKDKLLHTKSFDDVTYGVDGACAGGGWAVTAISNK
jgi:hypothetical protein